MSQVSETDEYILRHVRRYLRYYEACPKYPHTEPCRNCQPFLIGYTWWMDRLSSKKGG